MGDLHTWSGAKFPQRVVLEGRYTRLEPLAAYHEEALYAASSAPGADDRFRYLFEAPPADRAAFRAWMAKASISQDPLYFAVIDKATGRAEGRQALMRIVPDHGVIEIGSILWGPAIARTRVATESQFLLADYVFETLGYRRYEWKCNVLNTPSRRAAQRFGFQYEGTFRQHMVVKGENRDTAWFAMTDAEWPSLKTLYHAWLEPDNFDAEGRQRNTLGTDRQPRT